MKNSILITGGTSGIGKGLAQYFYQKDWEVMVTGRNKDKINTIKKEMPGIRTMYYDSLEPGMADGLVEFINEEWGGKLNILVNNAGHVELGTLRGIDQKSLENMYRAHLIAPTILTSKCLGFLEKTKGQILNVTSSHGIKVYPNLSAYGSAKAGLNMLTKIWALELAPLGINVNAIAPGPTETGILKSAGFSETLIDEIHRSEKAGIPLQRRGQVEDIVAIAALLLDSGSEWTTGVILPVDGGISIN